MEKILTVSIAAYNVQSTLKEALEPFVHCKYRNQLEVLIINDGSSDETENIASEYAERYPETFKAVNKENGGWGSTLNKGIELGIGKYFKQLDGDDYFSPENLDVFIEFLKNTDADMIYSPFVTFTDVNGAVLRIIGDYGATVPVGELMHFGEIRGFEPAMHTLCIKMNILKNNHIQITEHCFYTDVEFVLKCCNFCKTLILFDLPIYYYRLARSGQSMSIAGVRKHYKDHLKMLKTMLAYERDEVKDKAVEEVFHNRLKDACEFMYIFFFALERTCKQREELIAFDQMLKNNFPEYYDVIGNGAVKILRKGHFRFYRLIGAIQTFRDKRKRINIFEGN